MPARAVTVTPLNWLDLRFWAGIAEPIAGPHFAAEQEQRDCVQILNRQVDSMSDHNALFSMAT